MKSKKNIRQRRNFSKDYKQYIVSEYESGKFSVLELSRLHGIAFQLIYNWVYKYSTIKKPKIRIVEMQESSERKLKLYEKKIKELEQKIGKKQIQLDYLEELIEVANLHFGVDLKKNLSTKPLLGLEKKEED